MIRNRLTAITIVLAMGLAGCNAGSGSTPTSNEPGAGQGTSPRAESTPPPTIAAAGPYNLAEFQAGKATHRITNDYFPFAPGTVMILKGRRDGVPQEHKVTVLNKTKLIMGVRCAVVRDVVTSNGETIEIAIDWYAQDADGNAWYFGESTTDYENGVVVSTQGSWEAGIDGALPGIAMKADPKPGPAYYQEYRPGVAEDRGKVLRTGETVRVPVGTFHNTIVIRDTNPLDPTLVQHKWFARGVGVVKSVRTGSEHTETSRLVKITKG